MTVRRITAWMTCLWAASCLHKFRPLSIGTTGLGAAGGSCTSTCSEYYIYCSTTSVLWCTRWKQWTLFPLSLQYLWLSSWRPVQPQLAGSASFTRISVLNGPTVSLRLRNRIQPLYCSTCFCLYADTGFSDTVLTSLHFIIERFFEIINTNPLIST